MEINRLKPTVLASSMVKNGMLAGLALLSAACSNDPASPASPASNGSQNGIVAGTLEVSASGGVVKMRNTTEHQVGFIVVDKNQFVVALYPPCGTNCPVLVQGATTSVPYNKIGGYTPKSTEATVMWWRYSVRADGSKVPEGAIQTINVKLK